MPIITRIPISRHHTWWFLLLLFMWESHAPLSAQCTLSCNQGLQVSLDPSGQAFISPLLIAPNAGSSCPGPLTVTLYNNIGQQLPNPLNCNQIGQIVTAQVRHTSSGNSCTGTLQLFDALPPALSNCGDKFIFCNEDPSPNAVGFPTGTDNCTAPNELNFTHFDTETSLSCGTFQNGFPVLKRIDRDWTVTDEHGNSSTCQQRVWLKHITFADVVFPPNRDNNSAPALDCGQDPEDLDLTGQPMVNGVPVGSSPECEIGVTYSDQTIVHCAPAGFTLLRNWTMVDFCSGTFNNRTQIIKVEDTQAPVLVAPDDITVGTDGFLCSGSVTLPQAVFSDNCSAVTVIPSWFYGSGYGPFSGVTEGQHLVTYTATDACGNDATDTMMVTVVDNSPPQAICASDLQVSLTSNGFGYVNASTVNQGSFDNCGPVFLSISRDEIEYNPQVQVSCADQGAPIMLTLRVTDVGGLENFCQMEVTVRDFLKPTVVCPSSLTLNCLQDYNNLSLTGQATASDNCALQSLIHQDLVNIQPCNIGAVTRWWIATDSAANTKSCSQQITVTVINSTTVVFPVNLSISGCGSPADLLPAATGEPIIGGQACSPLSVNYTDQIFNIAAPSCFRIFRSWKLIDHCVYNPNGGSAGIWEHTQLIDVVDHTPPALSIPSDITVAADPFQCNGLVSMPDVSATDCSNQITYSHDSNFSGSGSTNNASGQYPLGVHLVTFTALDGCGNAAQQTLKITVKDLTPPTAVCLPGIKANIQASGSVTLDPNNFDGGCSDFCSPQNSLTFSISPSVFDCQNIGLQSVVLTVQDTAGNTAHCATQVLITDNTQVCGSGLVYQIDGTIRTETGLPVNNIIVSLAANDTGVYTETDSTGFFDFLDVPTGLTYALKPYNNANWLNGLTTYDLVLISKHILGTEPLNSPYKMLAADANNSGSITTFDIVQLRKIILGTLDSMPTNTSWRFVDAGYVFPDLQNPFSTPIPEEIVFDPLNANQSSQNFVGLKVGDLNGSTNPATARTPQDTLFLDLPKLDFRAGESFTVPLFLENWTTLEGLQFELKIDLDRVDLERVEFAQADILGQPNVALKAGGLLTLSWDNASTSLSAVAGGDARLLTLHLKAKADSEVRAAFGISNSRLTPEAYRIENEEIAAISLRFEKPVSRTLQSELKIFPNPSSGDFFVQNPFADEFSSLRIFDCLGQLVWDQKGFFPEMLEIQGITTFKQGLYFVELKGTERTMVGKLIVALED
ncbi:MAG: T9SS type A sorting domain-containing protein [Saprospiraceae bacterium]|nr:T9SS type A sorting domain-containing protein [Saprospiraceae bacterium]